MSAGCIYFISFVFTFASGYHTTTIAEKMDLDTEISASELYCATISLTEELNKLSSEISYDDSGASIMPYSYKELSKRVIASYQALASKTAIIDTFYSRIKPIALSKPMTYTHISGIYTSITGEANINTNYPDFIIASSSAHEMAHQRGVAREDEASFVGFLALMESDDPFLRYCAYLDVYSYLISDLKATDKELYNEAKNQLSSLVSKDLSAYSKSFSKYRDSIVSDVADKINDSYLQANGDKNGTKSYQLVSKLVCAYINKD